MFRSPIRIRGRAAARVAIALTLIGASFTMATPALAKSNVPPPRPAGPCDIYAAAGDPCVAAHATTRAMYASYNGPLYQVMRLSDNAVKNIGVVAPVALPFPDAGGYADAAAQDAFCANTYCLITILYDQSPMHNDLTQAPRGGFSGPAMGGFNNLPIADMAPITVAGHKAYGVYIEPGMGLRNNDTKGIAVDDQAEGQYWVINGQHYNSGCCFDYGNAEIDSRDDGNGTMETTYYGNAAYWYHGNPPGPWIMTDQENNLVGCVNPGSPSKLCADLPSITWRFATAMAKGEPHHWTSMGGNSQTGALSVMFDGPRIDSTYDPMRKQGAILLGNGGDNSNSSQGTFYEGAMTAAGTFPTDATDQLVQANVVAAKYDVQRLSLSPASNPVTFPRVAGRFGNAVKLNGTSTNQAVKLPNGIVSSLHDFTISAWVNPQETTTWSRIFDFGSGTGVYMALAASAGSTPWFAITINGNAAGAEQIINAPSALPLNQWTHIAVTLSGTTGSMYVNGVQVAQNTNMTLRPSDLGSTTQNWIGKSQYDDPLLNAIVDDFQIYDRALSAEELTALQTAPGAGNVAAYRFDEKSGATVLDSSGNGRDGTILAASTGSPGLQTFAPGSSQDTTVTFTNTTGSPAVGVKLSISVPNKQWTSFVPGTTDTSVTFVDPVAPGASVSATFTVTSGPAPFNGDLVGNAWWSNAGAGPRQFETIAEKVRNVSPIKINEFRIGTSSNPTDSFIELYNAGDSTVDLSNWALTEHPIAQAVFSTITIPAGTTIAAHGHYLLGLANSGLAAPVSAGERTVYLRNTTGLTPGDKVQIGTGPAAETRTISAVNATGATGPRVPGKIGNAVKLSGNGEYVALPNGIVSGLSDFTISAWVNPAADSTWSRIFDFGTGTTQYMFLTVDGGGSGLRFAITTGGNGAEQQLTGGGQLPLNTWSHVAVTLTGTTGRLYLNGNLVATNPNMTLHPSNLGNTTQNWIGRSQWPDPYLNAIVDDFQVYDHALSAAEIGTLASGQAGAGNVASYKFDEDSGPTALDSSGNGRNATIISDATAASAGTPLWQPLPDGPVITVPAGSTNVPVTSTSGFTVGQKLAIGYGDTMDVATVTAVGTAGTQAQLSAAAPAGATNIKVSSTANISAGDTIRLDIGTRIESVTITAVGTSGAGGTGLTLASPLQFAHSSNLPFSDRGTGVTFTPATKFAHSSNEPVQALGTGITLDTALVNGHAINTPVRDALVTTAGYQGTPTPNQWFGGPALSSSAGVMALRDATGLVVDSLNYGLLVTPWLAEGYQGTSPGSGCKVTAPGSASGAGRSAARIPDGFDTDSNCTDFISSNNPTPGGANLP